MRSSLFRSREHGCTITRRGRGDWQSASTPIATIQNALVAWGTSGSVAPDGDADATSSEVRIFFAPNDITLEAEQIVQPGDILMVDGISKEYIVDAVDGAGTLPVKEYSCRIHARRSR